jgi:DNA mismatch repair ATPase MutS
MIPKDKYTALLRTSEAEAKQMQRRLGLLSILRLAAFLSAVSALYFLWDMGIVTFLAFLLPVICFVYLIRKHTDQKDALEKEKVFATLCREELNCFEGNWRKRYDGSEFLNPSHPFTSDLNVFGRHSLFQYINRCQSPIATKIFAERLITPLTDAGAITREQAIATHFASDPEWSLRLLALAQIAGIQLDTPQRIRSWAQMDSMLQSKAKIVLLTRVLPALMILVTAALVAGMLTWNAYIYIALIPLLITGSAFKKHQTAFTTFTHTLQRVQGAAAMLQMIRERDFSNSPFREMMEQVHYARSAEALLALNKIEGAISSRNNIIVSIGLNALLMWDYQCMNRLERWRTAYAADLSQWIETIALAEALQSEAMYTFNHPGFIFAESNTTSNFTITGARHPLMNAGAVPNDLNLAGTGKFYIITGANMAGKSTYLRTVGLSLLLAMRGLPVAARYMSFQPCALYTSMLTTDSLGESESYFFSELKRLRSIVDSLERGGLHFLILDEILKGTNSTDKAEGSKRFMKKLLSLPAKGLIATHDLSLCNLSDEYPRIIENMRFEVHYTNNELDFRYKMEEGVCRNMNASFLLQKMGLAGE